MEEEKSRRWRDGGEEEEGEEKNERKGEEEGEEKDERRRRRWKEKRGRKRGREWDFKTREVDMNIKCNRFFNFLNFGIFCARGHRFLLSSELYESLRGASFPFNCYRIQQCESYHCGCLPKAAFPIAMPLSFNYNSAWTVHILSHPEGEFTAMA